MTFGTVYFITSNKTINHGKVQILSTVRRSMDYQSVHSCDMTHVHTTFMLYFYKQWFYVILNDSFLKIIITLTQT